MANVVIVPIDDRPCTRDFPAAVARIAGWSAAVPPLELLGSLDRPARFAELGMWLEAEAARDEVRGVVVALDTLAYGGTTSARRSPDSYETVAARLEVLPRLRARHPELPLLGFGVIMRVSDSNSDEEEKPYWREYGRCIYAYSYARDRREATGGDEVDGGTPGDEAALAELERAIPGEVLADYLAGRARNHQVNLLALAWAADGVLDDLVLTQDDTGAFGFNVAERRRLEAGAARLGLAGRVQIYPGADEVAAALTARLLNRAHERRPHVHVRFSRAASRAVTTRYEDRPLDELVSLHLQAAGAVRVDHPQEADALLFVHGPAGPQRDLWLEGPGGNGGAPDPEVAGFVADLAACLERGRRVALADVACANGADDPFMRRAAAAAPLHRLLAYAAWNTAGNTLGTVAAHLSARLLALDDPPVDPAAADRAHARFLVERFLDDWLYQARVRAGLRPLPRAETAAAGQRALAGEADAFFRAHLQGRDAERLHFHDLGDLRLTQPWGRLFEAGIGFRLDLSAAGQGP